MKRLLLFALLACTLTLTGCYHATVVTGAEPGSQTIEKPWATSFINGLIPPETVDATQQCNNGVARVETQLSFLNQIVAGLTFGLYSPMTITVTCASGGSMSDAGSSSTDMTVTSDTRAEIQQSLQKAADRTARTGEPTSVRVLH